MSTITSRARRRPWTRRTLAVAAAGALALACTTQTASASALGASYFGPSVVYNNVRVPMGTYYAYLSGSGTYVSYVKGWPYLNTPIGNVCNWNITAEFFDSNGNWYSTRSGPTHWGCNSYWGQANPDYIWVNGYVKRGFMCSTLKQNGVRLTSVCHSVY